MIDPFKYNAWENHGKKIILHMKDGTIKSDIFLGADLEWDNDIADGFILAVDGDTRVGNLVPAKDVERVEFAD